MTISVLKTVCDSISPAGKRITTFECVYSREFTHAHLLTHGLLNINAASNRAINIEVAVQEVLDNPFLPLHYGQNTKGMVASEELNPELIAQIKILLRNHVKNSAKLTMKLSALGLSKEVANRYLTPFQHIISVITATEWDNFFALRCAPDAQPETRVLAEEIRVALKASKPIRREYHLPYVAYEENHSIVEAIKLSAARCARVSYQSAGKARETDVRFADKLWANGHKSPFQHSAIAMQDIPAELRSNLKGWVRGREGLEEYYANRTVG